jgi:hypothetical protein
MSKVKLWALALAPILVAAYAFAAAPIVYPAKGQSQEQQSKDQYECHQWAVQQTGFDPSNPSTAQTTSSQSSQKLLGKGSQPNAVRGSARGAALGAVGGAIAGDAGKGAAAGAAMGGLGGAIRRRDQQSASASAPPASSASSAGLDAYNRAITACLTGRGYSVN